MTEEHKDLALGVSPLSSPQRELIHIPRSASPSDRGSIDEAAEESHSENLEPEAAEGQRSRPEAGPRKAQMSTRYEPGTLSMRWKIRSTKQDGSEYCDRANVSNMSHMSHNSHITNGVNNGAVSQEIVTPSLVILGILGLGLFGCVVAWLGLKCK